MKYFLILTSLICNLVLSPNKAKAGEVNIYDFSKESHSVVSRVDILNDPNLKEFYFSTHILKLDESGLYFIAMLVRAAERGVKVIGIVDDRIGNGDSALVTYLRNKGMDIGFLNPALIKLEKTFKSSLTQISRFKSEESDGTLITFLQQKGIEIGLFNPIQFSITDVTRPVDVFTKFNRRWHDKGFVAFFNDGRKLTLQEDKNISNHYFGLIQRFLPYQNTMNGRGLIIEGDFADQVRDYLLRKFESDEVVRPRPDRVISDRSTRKIQDYLNPVLERIDRRIAKRAIDPIADDRVKAWMKTDFSVDEDDILHISDQLEDGKLKSTLMQMFDIVDSAYPGEDILIENSYFVLFPELEALAERARKKGCKISVLTNLPELSDVKAIGWSSQVDLKKAAELGIDIYYISLKNKITHAKSIIVGDRLTANSSANFDMRSWNQNSESGVLIASPKYSTYTSERFWHRVNQVATIGSKDGSIFYGQGLRPGECRALFAEASTHNVSPIKKFTIDAIRNYL